MDSTRSLRDCRSQNITNPCPHTLQCVSALPVVLLQSTCIFLASSRRIPSYESEHSPYLRTLHIPSIGSLAVLLSHSFLASSGGEHSRSVPCAGYPSAGCPPYPRSSFYPHSVGCITFVAPSLELTSL